MISIHRALTAIAEDVDLARLLMALQDATDPGVMGDRANVVEGEAPRLIKRLLEEFVVTRRAVVLLRRIVHLAWANAVTHEGMGLEDIQRKAAEEYDNPN